MDIRSAQQRAWANKVAKGFNTTDVPLEFCLLQGELAEAFDAWHKDREDVSRDSMLRCARAASASGNVCPMTGSSRPAAAAAAGVAATGAIILAAGGWYWLDPAVALVIAVVVGYHAAVLLRKVVRRLTHRAARVKSGG